MSSTPHTADTWDSVFEDLRLEIHRTKFVMYLYTALVMTLMPALLIMVACSSTN